MSQECTLSQSSSLDDWLSYLESIHPANIEMGLARVNQVATQLNLLNFPSKIILIAGTNGKGTTARFLESLLLNQGFNVGTYSSPHLFKFNERVRINALQLDDQPHIDAFSFLEAGRGDIALTYFEYTTLAALEIFKRRQVDYILMEVGLGGRLDATNIVSPIASVITTIDLDHKDYLGDTRELVGYEKAGIFRTNIPAIVGDLNIPVSVINHGNKINANMVLSKLDFRFNTLDHGYTWEYKNYSFKYDEPAIPAQNVATALTTLAVLDLLPDYKDITKILKNLKVEGRFQQLKQSPLIYVDVAHNPESAAYLAKKLQSFKNKGFKIHALIGMLQDKDQKAVLEKLQYVVDNWSVASLNCARGATAAELADKLAALNLQAEKQFVSVDDALQSMLPAVKDKQLIIIFGSFFTVADAINYIDNKG